MQFKKMSAFYQLSKNTQTHRPQIISEILCPILTCPHQVGAQCNSLQRRNKGNQSRGQNAIILNMISRLVMVKGILQCILAALGEKYCFEQLQGIAGNILYFLGFGTCLCAFLSNNVFQLSVFMHLMLSVYQFVQSHSSKCFLLLRLIIFKLYFSGQNVEKF